MRPFLISCVLIALASTSFGQRPPMNPVDIVGVESCGDCHEEMVDSWQNSAHSHSFENLVASEKAREMAEVLQISPAEIPMRASCVRCHFTQESLAAIPQPTSSVSCESCHGEGYNWIDEHYKKSLSRELRIARSEEKGMIHPDDLSAISKTCYECHVIDDEQLVNHAGHPAFSEGFEIVSWYAGEVSHNFLVKEEGKAVKTHTGSLQPIPQTRKRMLYLVGKLHHVSQTLKALARAKDPPVDQDGEFIRLENGNYTYAVQHAMELRKLEGELKGILKRVSIPQLATVTAIIRGLNLKTGQGREMEAAALQISRMTDRFSEQHDGSKFAAIDPLVNRYEARYSANYLHEEPSQEASMVVVPESDELEEEEE